jgi:acetyl-CoA carboxylase carboxyltransferase component
LPGAWAARSGWRDRREEELLSIVPREPRQAYKMRRILEAVLDRDSVLELGDGSHLNLRFAWPPGNWGSLPMAGGLEAAYRHELEAAEDPEARSRRGSRP